MISAVGLACLLGGVFKITSNEGMRNWEVYYNIPFDIFGEYYWNWNFWSGEYKLF